MKGAVEALLNGIGLRDVRFVKEEGMASYENDVLSGIYCAERRIGRLGKVASAVMEAYDLKGEQAYLFEIDHIKFSHGIFPVILVKF